MGRSGIAAGDLVLLMAQNLDVLAGPLISLAYPLYASIRAIETKNVADDQQWLTYWVLYSLITLFELTFAKLIEWMPFWSYVKLIITCWLVIPQFSGAAYVYQQYIRPFYVGDRTINVLYVPTKKDVFTPTEVDTIFASDNYIHEYGPNIHEYGPNAFQQTIHPAFQPTIHPWDIDGEVKYRENSLLYEDDDMEVKYRGGGGNTLFYEDDEYVY